MAQILVIDDERIIRDLIVEILADAGHDVVGVETAEEGMSRLQERDIELVVSDVVMPGLSGLELLEIVREERPSLPVVLVTGAGTHATVTEALARGADGLVMKPFSHAELQRAVTTALDRASRTAIELRDRLLTPTVAGALANAIEAREASMHGHCERLAALAIRIGGEFGLADEELEMLRLGAILHDVGKIGIPDRVLCKDGTFTAEERALMRTHPLIGDRLLAPLDLLDGVRGVVRHHHERWDGGGYPDGLSGEEIPLHARIVAVADAVEAMSAKRVYRDALSRSEVVEEVRAGRGSQWDPAVADVALHLIETGVLQFADEGLNVAKTGPAPQAPPASVLLIEDDPDHAALALRALQSEFGNIAVTHARDAETATRLCQSSSWSLILVDQYLPDGMGLDLITDVRAAAPGVPIVMLTGEGSQEIAVEAFRRGASDYVVKSKGYLRELTGRVRMLLEAA